MINRFRGAALALTALAATVGIAYGAGNYETFPIIGQPTTCISTVTGTGGFTIPQGNTGGGGATGQGQGIGGSSVCALSVPAGPPAVTGSEMINVDTGLQIPATANMPASLLGTSNNRLIGGDMTTNLAQRLNSTKGIAALAGLSPTAAVITADRWWVIAPAAGVTVTMDTTAATAVIPGFNNTQALRIARTSSGAAGIICTGQTLDKAASAPLIGNNAVFSFYEENGATMSATNGAVTVNIDYTSAADGAATQATLGFAGLNGSKFALGDAGQAGTPTNYTAAVSGMSSGTVGTVTAGVANVPATTAWTRYAVYAAIPVNIPNTTTPVTSVSVSICFTPTATTAVATDYIEINGMQLEGKPSTATATLPNGVTSATGFDKRYAALEALYQQYYWYFNYENQAAITTVASCEIPSTTTANCLIPFPTRMRIVPAMQYTAGFQVFTTAAETAVNACSALATSSSYVTTPSVAGILVGCTATATGATAGFANFMTTLGTSSATGIISASAEP